MNYKMKTIRKFCLDAADVWVKSRNIDKVDAFLSVVDLIDKIERNYDANTQDGTRVSRMARSQAG